MSGSKPEVIPIDVSKLNLMQLTQLKNQLDQDLQFYQESLQNLKHAQSRFQESGEAVKQFCPENMDKDILVPLTGSMYVPGKLSNPEKVIVDVGTGYFVEKDIKNAVDYFTRKVKYVTEQMEKIQIVGNDKSKVREVVMNAMESKLAAQFAQQRISAPTESS